jgi:hypothetical protein
MPETLFLFKVETSFIRLESFPGLKLQTSLQVFREFTLKFQTMKKVLILSVKLSAVNGSWKPLSALNVTMTVIAQTTMNVSAMRRLHLAVVSTDEMTLKTNSSSSMKASFPQIMERMKQPMIMTHNKRLVTTRTWRVLEEHLVATRKEPEDCKAQVVMMRLMAALTVVAARAVRDHQGLARDVVLMKLLTASAVTQSLSMTLVARSLHQLLLMSRQLHFYQAYEKSSALSW